MAALAIAARDNRMPPDLALQSPPFAISVGFLFPSPLLPAACRLPPPPGPPAFPRKPADRCVRMKRPCGGEKPVCRRCQKASLENCHYSRQLRRPANHSRKKRPSMAAAAAAAATAIERVTLSPSAAVGLGGAEHRFFRSFLAAFGSAIPFGCTASNLVRVFLDASSCSPALGRSTNILGCSGGSAPADGIGVRDALGRGVALAVMAVGALISGDCKDVSYHAGLMLQANMYLQHVLLAPDLDDPPAVATAAVGGAAADAADAAVGAAVVSGCVILSRGENATSAHLPTSALLCVVYILEGFYHLASGRKALWEECLQHAVESYWAAWSDEHDRDPPALSASIAAASIGSTRAAAAALDVGHGTAAAATDAAHAAA
ncbi:unnamed protein product, partial [Phaeothamnion confervicola]